MLECRLKRLANWRSNLHHCYVVWFRASSRRLPGAQHTLPNQANCPHAQGKAGPPMLSLRQAGEQQWAANVAVGRAKAYLVGSPYATELGFANVLAGRCRYVACV